ncbi:hypothetical protein E2C01_037575 [Portunus trituberculatus]|uniref:Uncharacterized protein n=1 Tax=Portunus trituberculatus TaxID=210409 RepID=A0A5B7FG01_PORTR|nr:hypothetical protein [Portunus trituberculatus]
MGSPAGPPTLITTRTPNTICIFRTLSEGQRVTSLTAGGRRDWRECQAAAPHTDNTGGSALKVRV